MKTYTLMHILDASTTEEVEAESPEAALNSSYGHLGSLCWQCSEKFDICDIIKTVVLLDGEEVGGFQSFDEEKFSKLERRYELAQRARARNLVVRLDVSATSFWVHTRNLRWADRIAAKYLGGKS